MTLSEAANLFLSPLFSSFQLMTAMALFCWRQPRRERFGMRAGLVVFGYLAATLIATYIGFVAEPRLMGEWSFNTQMLLFGSLAFMWVGIIYFCYEISIWAAVFLAVAGFSAFHALTGVIGTIVVLAGGAGILQDVESSILAVFPLEINPFVALVNLLATVIVYWLCYRFFACNLRGEWVARPSDRSVAVIFLATLLIDVAFNLSMMSTYSYGVPVFQRTVFGITKTFICFFLLFVEFQILLVGHLQTEVAIGERMLVERTRQYELSRENIEAINLKCHDIRHQIRQLEAGSRVDPTVLADIAREVDVYDAAVKTGNDALDTILTEKSLLCGRNGITLSCIADGAALAFLQPTELYALFGNILDNAIEAILALSEREKRNISLMVQRRGDMVSIHEENYFEGDIVFEDGLPKTTKGDTMNHGFGTRSIRTIVESHEGSLAIGVDNGLFHLDALIPIP